MKDLSERQIKRQLDKERRRNLRAARRSLHEASQARDAKGCFLIVAAIGWTLVVCGGLLTICVIALIHSLR